MGVPHPRRAEGLEMLREGMSLGQVANAIGADRQTVWTWRKSLGGSATPSRPRPPAGSAPKSAPRTRSEECPRAAALLGALRDNPDPYLLRRLREDLGAQAGASPIAERDEEIAAPATSAPINHFGRTLPEDRLTPEADATCPQCGAPAIRHPPMRHWTRETGSWVIRELVRCQGTHRHEGRTRLGAWSTGQGSSAVARGCGVVVVSERPDETRCTAPTLPPTPITTKETKPMRETKKATPAKVDGNQPGFAQEAPKADNGTEGATSPVEALQKQKVVNVLTREQIDRAIHLVLDEGRTNTEAARAVGGNKSAIRWHTAKERRRRQEAAGEAVAPGDVPTVPSVVPSAAPLVAAPTAPLAAPQAPPHAAIRLLTSDDVREFLSLPQSVRDAMVLLLGACAQQA